MTDNRQDVKPSNLDDSPLGDEIEPTSDVQVPGRRKLVLGSGAILATLASGSVLGDGKLGYMCSPSGFMSGNLSTPGAESFRCGGISPGGWRQNADGNGEDGSLADWYGANAYPFNADHSFKNHKYSYSSLGATPPVTATTFVQAFTVTPLGGDSSTTLMEVLGWSGSVEFHCVAGYLNASLFFNQSTGSGIAFYIAPSVVIDIYKQYKSMGYYETSTGDKLYAEDIKDFFNRTYH